MNSLENRVEKLEDLIGIFDENPGLVRIDVADCSKNSTDKGTPFLVIVPGQINRPGVELFRREGESPADFLDRAELRYKEFYS